MCDTEQAKKAAQGATKWKPCPLCGLSAIENKQNCSSQFVNCSGVSCTLGETWLKYGINVLTWNTRPAEDALAAQVAALTAERDEWMRVAQSFNVKIMSIVKAEPLIYIDSALQAREE